MKLSDQIIEIKGVGEKTSILYKKLNIETIEDLFELYPRQYLAYEDCVDIDKINIGERVAVLGTINSNVLIKNVKNLKIVSCTIKDLTGEMKLTWFNAVFLKQMFRIGQKYIFVGTVVMKGNQKVMEQSEYFTVEKYNELTKLLQPIYPLTDGITNNMIRKNIKTAMPLISSLDEYIPKEIVERYKLMDYKEAIMENHFPKNLQTLKVARERIIFDEFFVFLLAMNRIKEESSRVANLHKVNQVQDAEDLINKLPYSLTSSQLKVISEIKEDISSDRVMNRLIQGDVGSGKTIVALIAMLMCVKSGFQGALMVPTEVLARQHYEYFSTMLHEYHVNVQLLTGTTKLKDKRFIYDGLEKGEVDIVIGTHALIQEKVKYKQLGIVVTDEQHRFGVRQREILAEKGDTPHVLVMSATPIPRTLAIIMYGDLDISIIDELPANRLPIKNCVVNPSYRSTAYRFIGQQVRLGHQVYVICPMVSSSENLEVENVEEYVEVLRGELEKDIRIEYLHGKMSSEMKNDIMNSYVEHRIDVLVSTTVIEVGINVPNSTVMMIENAERFGLAQLHQLRGRVGRGDAQSYCIMICGKESDEAKERLEVLNHSNDGFYIANEDLKLRGAGDFFGLRQSGEVLFNLADIYNHASILKDANSAMDYLLKNNYDIRSIHNDKLMKKIDRAISI